MAEDEWLLYKEIEELKEEIGRLRAELAEVKSLHDVTLAANGTLRAALTRPEGKGE